MDNLKNYRKILKYLPNRFLQAFEKVSPITAASINEIRLRTNRPICVSSLGKNFLITANGSLTSHGSLGMICTQSGSE